MSNQTTDTVFMVKPVNFTYNTQTASNNSFQKKSININTQDEALKEVNDYIKLLTDNKVNVISVNDTPNPHTPDSVFPNNWFSTHGDILVLYPMYAENRRLERKQEFIDCIKNNYKIIDLTHYENEGLFLEGTGSMVLDRINKIVYACRSPRTSEIVLDDFCEKLGYEKIIFTSVDKSNKPIYHTNVVMSIGIDFAFICLDSIKDKLEKEKILNSLKETNKLIIDINYDQLEHFLGNALEIKSKDNERILVMSDTAYNCLTKEQLKLIENKCKIIHPNIPTIEINGGGSARCMIAEIFN